MLEIITIVVSLFALATSFYVGVKQVRISQTQMEMQNKVELYLLVDSCIHRDKNGEKPDQEVPAIFIRNVGSSVIYLEKYIFNGREYPKGKTVIPSVSAFSNAFYWIELPTNGVTHVSLEITFLDWKMRPWKTVGYADFKDGKWEISHTPCERIIRN